MIAKRSQRCQEEPEDPRDAALRLATRIAADQIEAIWQDAWDEFQAELARLLKEDPSAARKAQYRISAAIVIRRLEDIGYGLRAVVSHSTRRKMESAEFRVSDQPELDLK